MVQGWPLKIANPGSVSSAFEGFNLPGALLAMTQQLPLPTLVSILFLILTTIFIVTTGDSMTYTISVVISGETEPKCHYSCVWGRYDGGHCINIDFPWLWRYLCAAVLHCDHRCTGFFYLAAITVERTTNCVKDGERARVITFKPKKINPNNANQNNANQSS